LASKSAGTLELRDDDDALSFDAEITPQVAATSYGFDTLKLVESGLVRGLSPGFRLPPARAVERAETVEQEPADPARGMHGALIRRIWQALLFELSIVTSGAYDEAGVELRNWQLDDTPALARPHALARWRL
jgi:phage head maturation protease